MKESNPYYLHIVAFNIPYPADYGGVIDVFYKIKALSNNGIRVILHCYHYGRDFSPELEKLCHQVYYYKRNTGVKYLFDKKPYIVSTRRSIALLQNLTKDNYPVLFEGLHCTFFLKNKKLNNRFKIVRMHNVESDYYESLAASEKKLRDKLYFIQEAKKLKAYEKILHAADAILAISPSDFKYLNQKYGKTIYIAAFHPNDKPEIKEGKGDYLLYHGNLSVRENISAVNYLIDNVFGEVNHNVIIAGKNPDKEITDNTRKYNHIKLVANPSDNEIEHLINHAQINVLYTSQPTGIKLKLLKSLFSGRHCVVNPLMAENTGLESFCHIATNNDEMKATINKFFSKPFMKTDINKRTEILQNRFSNQENAQKIINLINGSF